MPPQNLAYHFKMIAILATLAFVQFTHIVDFMILMPLGPRLMSALGIGPSEFSVLVSSYTFAAGISGLGSALWLDKVDRKRALIVCYTGFALGSVACGLSPSYGILLFARTLTGAFGGVLGSVILAIIGDTVPAEKRGRAMGLMMMAFSAASVFGVPLSLMIAARSNWHAPFILVGVAAIFALGFAIAVIPSMRGHMGGKKALPLAQVVLEPNRLRGLILMSSLVLGQFSVLSFLSPYLVLNAGMLESQLPLVYLTGGVVSVISSPLWGRGADRLGASRVLTAGLLVSIVPFLLVTHLGPQPLGVILATTILLFVCMGGRMIPAMTLIQAQVGPENRGTYMSVVTSVQQFSSALAALIAGQVITRNGAGQLEHYGVIGIGSAVLALIALLSARSLGPKPVPRAKAA